MIFRDSNEVCSRLLSSSAQTNEPHHNGSASNFGTAGISDILRDPLPGRIRGLNVHFWRVVFAASRGGHCDEKEQS